MICYITSCLKHTCNPLFFNAFQIHNPYLKTFFKDFSKSLKQRTLLFQIKKQEKINLFFKNFI